MNAVMMALESQFYVLLFDLERKGYACIAPRFQMTEPSLQFFREFFFNEMINPSFFDADYDKGLKTLISQGFALVDELQTELRKEQ